MDKVHIVGPSGWKMTFPLQLFSRLLNWLTQREPASPESRGQQTPTPYELDGSQVVARFIFSQRKISKLAARPKPSAFDPSPHNELSTVHSTGLADDEVWMIGSHALGAGPERNTIHGRADVPVHALIEQKLRAVRDDNPFERHTSVLGWPSLADPKETKQLRLQICLELSQHPEVTLAIPKSSTAASVHGAS
jgi:hypothetical protein